MKIELFSTIIFVILSAFTQINAQVSDIKILKADVQKADSVITIMAEIDISNLEITKDRSIRINPQLADNHNSINLPPILIDGRNKHILFKRNPEKDIFGEYLRKNGTTQIISYSHTMKYKTWMGISQFKIDIDRCGCGNNKQQLSEMVVMNIRVDAHPYVAYIKPLAEDVKNRKEQGFAFLDFPVNQTYMDPEFRNNIKELSKIYESIEKVKNDSDVQITTIHIHGYASPEGGFELNKRLAQNRSISLKKYLAKKYNIDPQIISVNSTPEDWDGVRQYVEQNDLIGKKEILAIINSQMSPAKKDLEIKKINNGSTYQYLLINCYPALRRSEYVINYVVRGFNTEEAKEILKTKPQQLSLNEIYQIAQTMKEGDDDFDELFDIAVMLFPDDPTANLNASSIYIRKKDLKKAEKYLLKSDQNKAETKNNLVALALLQGNMDDARRYFYEASEMGLNAGSLNLEYNVK